MASRVFPGSGAAVIESLGRVQECRAGRLPEATGGLRIADQERF
jgi:hypothetical protein